MASVLFSDAMPQCKTEGKAYKVYCFCLFSLSVGPTQTLAEGLKYQISKTKDNTIESQGFSMSFKEKYFKGKYTSPVCIRIYFILVTYQ